MRFGRTADLLCYVPRPVKRLAIVGSCSLMLASLSSCATGSDETSSNTESGGAGGTGAETGGAGGSGGNGGTSTGGSSGETGEAGAASELPGPDCPPPDDLGVRIVGRHDGCEPGAVRMAWSGTGFVARFEGTGLSITQTGSIVYYTVVVDGEVADELITETGEHTYDVVSDLDPGEHTVEVYRQSEANFGPSILRSVDVTDGKLLDPPPPPERHIEIYGDSVTCGYGNEGTSTSCSFSAETENHYLTYGAILARVFDAELSTVAWSGKGVVVNYGGDMGIALPEMAERVLPNTSTSVWDYSLAPEPDLVMINLGTNDFSTTFDPELEDFTAGYADFLLRLRARYPHAFILCTVGPLLTDTDLSKARTGIGDAVAQLNDAGDDAVVAFELQATNPSPGCDWHPNLSTHEAMADELSVPVAEYLDW